MALVPQVVDAVAPIPVVASGGIFDGRGIAAAFMLGAVGVNLGTRFIASKEAPAPIEWKQAITAARSEDVKKFDVLNDISPIPGTVGFPTVLRSIPTAFLDEWSAKREDARRDRDHLTRPDCLNDASWPSARVSANGGPDRRGHHRNTFGSRDYASAR